MPALLAHDVVLRIVEVVFVLDVADDLLEHVLDCDQARHAAVLVDHDRHVVAVRAEFAQQHVQALGLGHENGGPQHVAHVELFLSGVVAQQVLREQDADDVVAILVDDGEARVRRGDHVRDELVRGLADVDHVHLSARHHDVAHLHLGDLQRALDHRKGVGVEEISLERRVQQLEQLLAVLRLAHQQRGKPFK